MQPRFLTSLLMALALLGAPALAQDREPGTEPRNPERLSSEEVEAAWVIEAQSVAHRLGLSEDDATQLSETYVEARQGFRKAFRTMRQERGEGEGARRPGSAEALQKMLEEHHQKLEKQLGSFLDEQDARKAAAPLGTFSNTWDAMTHALVELDLDENKMMAAMAPTQKFIMDTTAIRLDGDRATMAERMRESRQAFATELGKVLDEKQLAAFHEVTRREMNRGIGREARGGGGASDRLMQFDENGDGKLQRDEVPERMVRQFERFDANEDGVLDEAELEAMRNRERERGERPDREREREGGGGDGGGG